MTKNPIRRYIVDGKLMTAEDLRRLHDYLADIEVIDVISDEMRIVVESEWPEFIHKLPPRRCSKWRLFRKADWRAAERRGPAFHPLPGLRRLDRLPRSRPAARACRGDLPHAHMPEDYPQ
jgi:hypothetical protein